MIKALGEAILTSTRKARDELFCDSRSQNLPRSEATRLAVMVNHATRLSPRSSLLPIVPISYCSKVCWMCWMKIINRE